MNNSNGYNFDTSVCDQTTYSKNTYSIYVEKCFHGACAMRLIVRDPFTTKKKKKRHKGASFKVATRLSGPPRLHLNLCCYV